MKYLVLLSILVFSVSTFVYVTRAQEKPLQQQVIEYNLASEKLEATQVAHSTAIANVQVTRTAIEHKKMATLKLIEAQYNFEVIVNQVTPELSGGEPLQGKQ